MKVVAFNGSPRKKGNTSILIKTVLEEIENEGIETEIVQLAGKDIKGCVACFKCLEKKNFKCVAIDDFINVCIKKMIKADGILLGSPTYFCNVSTEMKALIDRAGMVAFANAGILRHKVGASVSVANRTGATQALMMMNTLFLSHEMFIVGSNYPNMALGMEKGDVEKDAWGLQIMKVLGQNMALLLKKLNG
ncbi:MAG: flavodoxin family protein [Pseudomonadota bacterium]